MSIATALLAVGALGIVIIMHLVGHSGHGASHGQREDVRPGNSGISGGAKSHPSPEEARHE